MSSIQEELYYELILLRLPVKSLLVCKSVCKHWFELISNPSFVNTHAKLFPHRNNFISLTPVSIMSPEYVVHSIGYETLASLSESDQVDDDDMFKGGSIFSSIPHPYMELLCSCNGLVCLNFQSQDHKPKIRLWKPATREYKKLPTAPTGQITPRFDDFYQCALGYDFKINDYKFVTIVSLAPSCTHEILVYTLGSNSWRKIQNTSRGRIGTVEKRQSWVLLNGAFHWLGTRNKDDNRSVFLLSFDITSERSTDIQLPREALDKGWCVRVGLLEGCLCVIDVVKKYYFDPDLCQHRPQVIVWVMQEYGVGESWSKRYVINQGRVSRESYYLKLIWCFENGEILFSSNTVTLANPLFIFNLKVENVRAPNLPDSRITNVISYFETLVSLKSGRYTGENGEIELSTGDEGAKEESS